ncbi:receptor-like protein kinase [Pyrus ussuriensis x Pyrus communis]|uniref:non-specific serine/threonine protein kinase n=1 Tax=Pyrus ussuriensis x Pyrus communis TaxID=2448454 RepID=A0A5N5HHJ5_9ROSA|nr:receptor-like protein kinase [Pyrus ussuriensis x Pyrus communis]
MAAIRMLPFTSSLFTVFLVVGFFCVVCSAKDDRHQCAPSSCGIIPNISYPFRLKHDPHNCGDQRYNLSCENNRTVLYLYSGKYYVQSINYDNYTIRIVDVNLREGDCSSMPHHSLAGYNLDNQIAGGHPYSICQIAGKTRWNPYLFDQTDCVELSKPIIFMTCETQVNSPLYVDTSPCTSLMSSLSGYVFVKIGHLNASDMRDLCRIDLTVATSWPGANDMNISYVDIHKELVYGFELSWLQGKRRFYSRRSTCYIDYDTGKAACSFNGITVLGIPCVIGLLIYKWKKRHLSMYVLIEEFLQSHNNLMPIRYSYSDIKKMTRGFKEKLGEGGYGSVYKGKLRSGRFVAIKMLGKSKANGQDFINEVGAIGRIHHVNVVQLIGYCAEGSKRALVYEFMSNGSLDRHIFPKEGLISLSCKKTFEISVGVARGISYLHQGCDMQILHFDIKPHNILLDDNFVPKVSDFGLISDSSLTLTAARGTIGYIAPELFYKNIGGVSNKADIYSFGMLLMEIAGRRKNLNRVAAHESQIYIPSWVYDQFSEGNDIEIEGATEEENEKTKKMLIVALWCIQFKPSDRPASMNKVVEMLEGEIECLEMPPKPFLYPQEKPVVDDEDDSETTRSSGPSKDDVQESQSLIQNADGIM